MSEMHVYLVTEDDFIYHTVTAENEDAAIAYVRGFNDSAPEVNFDADPYPDDDIFSVTLVDSNCKEDDPDVRVWLSEPGFTVDLTGEYPVVSAACRDWASGSTQPQYLTCSEW